MKLPGLNKSELKKTQRAFNIEYQMNWILNTWLTFQAGFTVPFISHQTCNVVYFVSVTCFLKTELRVKCAVCIPEQEDDFPAIYMYAGTYICMDVYNSL